MGKNLPFIFSFKSPVFYVTILEFVDNFSKGIISLIPSTISSCQNHYQGNIYA